jgi:DNA-binding XRE family transcriptional regulator
LYRPTPRLKLVHLEGDELVCEFERGGKMRATLAELGVPRRPKIVSAHPDEFRHGVVLVRKDGSEDTVGADFVRRIGWPGYSPAAAAKAREEIKRRIATRLRARRQEIGVTMEWVAQRAGLTKANYARLESGRHLHQLDVLDRVARVLGAKLVHFIAVEPERPAAAARRRGGAAHPTRRHGEARPSA